MSQASRPTILTIEDEPVVRTGITAFLEDHGFRVVEAEDGRAGLEAFERTRPALVLVDLRMPEVDGLEVLRQLSRRSPEIPLIVVSGTGVIADVIEALRAGAWDYVLKPVADMAVLLHAVHRSLEQARLRRENREYHQHLEETLKRLRQDEEAGRRMQMRLLPPPTATIGPYALQRHLLPSQSLSGDFVDYYAIGHERTVFYVADVSGHGVSSALVTVLLKSFMRRFLENEAAGSTPPIRRPGLLLQKLNAELIHEDIDKHVTVFYGILDNRDNTLTFSNGGHFPPPILWANNGSEFIMEQGTAVGLFPFATYEDVVRPLPDDFLLAFFSDGILEALPQEDLDAKLAFLQTLGSAERIEQFVEQLGTHQPLPDDATVLTVARGSVNVPR